MSYKKWIIADFDKAFAKKIADCMKKYFSMQNLCIDAI